MITRRSMFAGMAAAAIAAPAIIRTPGLIMPIKALRTITLEEWAKVLNARMEMMVNPPLLQGSLGYTQSVFLQPIIARHMQLMQQRNLIPLHPCGNEIT